MFKSLARELPVIVSFVGETMERETRRAFLHAGVLLAAEPSLTMRRPGIAVQARALPEAAGVRAPACRCPRVLLRATGRRR